MKKAYFVLGLESTGTRLLTRCLMEAGAYGDSGHEQRLDELGFKGHSHEKIVLRRSIPHAGNYPEITSIIHKMQAAGYDVIVLITCRDLYCTEQSQIRHGHTADTKHFREKMFLADALISSQLSILQSCPNCSGKLSIFPVRFESLTTSSTYRQILFPCLGVDTPTGIEFEDANRKYYEERQ